MITHLDEDERLGESILNVRRRDTRDMILTLFDFDLSDPLNIVYYYMIINKFH